ncbi:Pentatricopeptide repeat-containing protein, mitochondrial [Glycine max]|nr:Pentatricopeptide repeat-containing protein, mitochondrial [Glycine max]
MQVRYSYVRRLCSVLGSPSAKRGTTKTQSSSSSLAKLFVDDDSTLSSLKLKRPSDSGDSSNGVFKHISSIFYADKSAKKPDSEEIDGEKKFENMSNLSWLSSVSQSNVLLQWKEQSRKKKQKCVFDFTQESRFQKLVEVCARILGPEATIELFGKVGREPDVKGYNTLVEMCIDKARGTDDKDIAIQELGKVFNLFKSMREQGLELQEQTYRPLLLYLIDMCMVEEFQFFCVVIEDENPSSVARLGYYEMLMWLKDNNEEKIQGICDNIAENKGEDTSDIQENYLLALCESERMEEILKLLEIIDIKNLSSAESVAKVFQALGRLLLEPVAEKFLLDFKTSDHEADNITDFIASYAVSIPDLSVKDVIKKFKDLHQRLEVSPSSSSYEKLILHSCALLKVHVALDIVDEMCEAGLTLSTKVLHSILQICDDTSEYNLLGLHICVSFLQEIAPRCMLFADDIVLLGESREELNERLETWRRALETHGFRLSRSISEYMECTDQAKGKVLSDCGKTGDLYGTECWAVKSQHENKVGVAEMRMLRWMCGKTRQDKIRNEAIRERVGVAPIVEKMVENRLRWFGHVERRPVDSVVRRVDQMERRQTIRGRGRPKKTIREVIKKDLELNDLDRSMVHRIFSTIHRYNLESNDETFRSMIDLFLKMKDIEGAYKMLDDLGKLNLKPSPGMYNAILEECFREKNISDGVRVLEHMQCADVKPDSQTFSYLISNSETEEDIVKYYEELKQSGIVATKQIFMALVNAYAACGQLEKAKKVILDPLIPPKSLNQIKGFLVSVLASHGKLSEALVIYEEIKQSGHKLEAKEVTSLIEHTHSEGELDRLLLLLKELDDTDYWNDACCRIILYCIWNKHLSSAVELCNLLKDKFQSDEQVMEFLFDKVFSLIEESEESSHLHTCSELLSEIKDKLGLLPSHKRHDSLLCACANATDLHDSE